MKKANLRQFDYERVAHADAEMWRTYYNHQFFKLFWQLLQLIKSQLGLGWLITLRLAYHAGIAAADYRIHKNKGTNNPRVIKHLAKFYRIICKHSTEPFDYKKVAELEFEWWEIHRRSYKNNIELEKSLADAVAVMYNMRPDQFKEYAHCRAEAMIIPRHEGDKQAARTDWDEVHRLVNLAWKHLHEAIQ